ncbi:SUKH-4 family immunity protein [Streptomyces sp. MUM 136J]|uniref:SUKH-4 family immunity protein n=1 Tax=Streptomyces sp. MUM 136J TaxID=2791992 RepID=UPI001F03DC6A|nr:SUKH-4 family immunity protein [Streptomyces sp. MUM 136J]MCH0569483.1 SUKH-4 family immunity protein [Streptomyces sp. MUM 136J]
MVTFAQAQERAEEWVNGDVPAYQHREVRVREFELGFVVWAEDRVDGPRSDGGAQRLVIARDSGEATLWPALPVGEVIRRYEEEYGRADEPQDAVPAPAARVDLNQTSFLLSPPVWLQEAADKLGIQDRRGDERDGSAAAAAAAAAGPAVGGGAPGAAGGRSVAADQPAGAGALAPTQAGPGVPVPGGPGAAPVPEGATPWTGTDTNADPGEDRSVPLPATVFAPQLSGDADEDLPPLAAPEAETALITGGSRLPRTAVAPALDASGAPVVQGMGGAHGDVGAPGGVQAARAEGASATPGAPAAARAPGSTPPPPPGAPSYGYPQGPGAPAGPATAPPGGPQGAPVPGAPQPPGDPGAPGRPLAPNAGDIADAATSKAAPPPRRGRGAPPPPPPGAPGMPGGGAVGDAVPPPPPGAAGGYVPTQLVSALGPDGPEGAQQGASAPNAPNAPGAPQSPGAPGMPNPPAAPGGSAGGAHGAVHHAETVLAAPPVAGPGAPPAPPVPGAPQSVAPGAMPPPPGRPIPGGPPAAYGYPQQPPGRPTVGPGYQAVLRYRAQDGSEQQLIRRSAPGTPHPEWQIFHELRAMNVPPDQVLELHTELESCELPGAYCARMIREQWPQARITSIAPYGTDHASRQQGMQRLLAHQGELHQVADGPARMAPVRAPLPPVQPLPPVPPEGIAQELGAAFGPGVFHFEQAAVSRQGVPPIVAHTLVVAGLPVDVGPFFWAQAQPGRPVPTLAELAAERRLQPAVDAGSYLVMGSDFGKALCVQYGTANIVAVPVEAGPGGVPVPPQFVNSGLPEFQRCLALLGRMWRLRFGLNQEQAGRWTVDFQAQLASLDPAALGSPENWWSVLLEQMWDGLL